MRTTCTPRGFSLVELIISMVVTAVVLTGAIAAANAQQRAFHGGQRARVAQDNARTAMLYLEQKLPLVGYGMDPSLAIDFSYYTNGPCPAEAVPCLRDNPSGPDELVFYARNPSYWVPAGTEGGPYQGKVWRLVSIANDDTGATLDARKDDRFAANQILQVVCPGTLKYAYFTVGATTTATADGPLLVPLANKVTANPFLRQDVARTVGMNDCRVFQIDTYRLHIRPVAQGGGRYVPYLVLDRKTDEVLIAEGIEDMQVAYLFANPAVGQAGATADTSIAFSTAPADQNVTTSPGPDQIARTNFGGTTAPSGKTVYAPSSFYAYPFSSPMRQTSHQANIRGVRIALVTRGADPNPDTRSNLVVDADFKLFNQTGAPGWVTGAPALAFGTDGYQRIVSDFTVDLPNMTVRSVPGF